LNVLGWNEVRKFENWVITGLLGTFDGLKSKSFGELQKLNLEHIKGLQKFNPKCIGGLQKFRHRKGSEMGASIFLMSEEYGQKEIVLWRKPKSFRNN
jgi:hypothetical protein